MKLITKKPEIKKDVDICLSKYDSGSIELCVEELHTKILAHKVKFPLLEYAAGLFYESIPESKQIEFCDRVESLKTIGGNVIIGNILQKRVPKHFKESMNKTTEYISKADAWYVCDIIGERVFGYSLLYEPKKTIPVIKTLSKHKSNWVVRSLGAGSHYAIKKGLGKQDVDSVFQILLTMAKTKDKEIRQGVGWAAKTTAKFHPEIIQTHKTQIEDSKKVANWFRVKVKIGLNRNLYAKRNRS